MSITACGSRPADLSHHHHARRPRRAHALADGGGVFFDRRARGGGCDRLHRPDRSQQPPSGRISQEHAKRRPHMTSVMQAMAIESFVSWLMSLAGLLDKGAAHARDNRIDLVNARLSPDMYTLAQQVHHARHYSNH